MSPWIRRVKGAGEGECGDDQESLLDPAPAGSSGPSFQLGLNLGPYKLQTLNTNDFIHSAVPLLVAQGHIPRMTFKLLKCLPQKVQSAKRIYCLF